MTALIPFVIAVWSAGNRDGLLHYQWGMAVLAMTLLILVWLGSGAVILALLLMLLGFSLQDRPVLAVGLLLFPLFLFHYYYSLDLDLLKKSGALIGSGVAILLLRAVSRRDYSILRRLYEDCSYLDCVGVRLRKLLSMVLQKDALLKKGQTVYLALAPVDPRSMMQGDYMALNYDIMNRLNHDQFDVSTPKPPRSGALVVQIDSQRIGRFVRFDGGVLATGEHLLKFHHANWRAVIGAESFFIPEGTGEAYAKAAYAEMKLEPDGTPLMVALCDKQLHRLVSSH